MIRLALCLDPTDPYCAGIVDKGLRAINPSCAKNEKDRRARLAKKKEIFKELFEGEKIPLQAVYPNFGVYQNIPLKEQVAVPINVTSLQRLSEKFVRGIFLIEDQKLIEAPYEISFFVLSDEGAKPIVDMLEKYGTIHAREPGVVVQRAVAPEDAASSFFLIEIWKRFKMYAAVQRKENSICR